MISGKKRSEKEYRKLDILSGSDLKVFATEDRRTFFKKCILREKVEDESSRASKIGSAVHCLRLEPQEFDNKYFMSICSEPPTGNMKKFVDSLYKHTIANTDESGVVLLDFEELAELAYAESGYKRDKLPTVLGNFKGKEPEMFYRERRACGTTGKELICTEDRNISDRIVETLKNHEYTRDIFGENSLKETQIDDFEIDGLPLKAMIDDIEISGNTITITDLKVTWTNENFYKEYFLKRRSDIQAFVYRRAVKSKFPDHKINKFRFVAADSTNFNAPLIYEIEDSWEDKTYNGFTEDGRYYKGLKEIISEIKWHLQTDSWGISKKAYDNLGIIKID